MISLLIILVTILPSANIKITRHLRLYLMPCFFVPAYNLKHARDLIRAISKRVKPNPLSLSRQDIPRSAYPIASSGISSQYPTGTSISTRNTLLPPVMGHSSYKRIMY